jgi:hypothetical protein
MSALGQEWETQIFATDIDDQAIEKARQGRFPDNIAADITPERLQKFFVADGKTYQISKSILRRQRRPWRLTFEHNQLLAQERVLGDQVALAARHIHQCPCRQRVHIRFGPLLVTFVQVVNEPSYTACQGFDESADQHRLVSFTEGSHAALLAVLVYISTGAIVLDNSGKNQRRYVKYPTQASSITTIVMLLKGEIGYCTNFLRVRALRHVTPYPLVEASFHFPNAIYHAGFDLLYQSFMVCYPYTPRSYAWIVKKNVAPSPGWDSTQICPPWRSTTFLQMAKPMPVPGYWT